jgi:phage gpG-like protein
VTVIPRQFEASDAGDVLTGFGRALVDHPMDTPLTATLGVFREGIWGNFSRTEGPDGNKWPKRVDNLPHPLLFKTGKMLEAAIGEGSGGVTEIGPRDALASVDQSVVKYAGYHMTGTKNKDGSPRMPARPYFYAGGPTLDSMTDTMATHTLRMLLP